jgi:hypothetical protein
LDNNNYNNATTNYYAPCACAQGNKRKQKKNRAATRDLVSCPDPTLKEGKGSGEFGHNPWARERNLSAPMRLQL